MHVANGEGKAVFPPVPISSYAKQHEPSSLAYSIVITALKPQQQQQQKPVTLFQEQ